MKYIIDAIHIIQKAKHILAINSDSYTESIRNLRLTNEANINDEFRHEVIQFLYSLEIHYMKNNIASILCPNTHANEFTETYISDRKLEDLNNVQLIRYLGSVLWTISFNEKEDMLLLKYNKCVHNTGWHNLAKECRGRIIDKHTMEIISYGFDKFYNYLETEETNEENIKRFISIAKRIYVMDKKDGSTILVSNHKGNVLVTTNGSFDGVQTYMAKDILEEKYNIFYHSVPEGFTFVFELIHPGNRIVVNYGDEKKLCLLAIRNLKNGKLLPYEDVLEFTKKNGLVIVEVENFTNMNEMVLLANKMTDANKEGWVFRLLGDEFDIMFKLKLKEYFMLHRCISSVSVKRVYNVLLLDQLESFLDSLDDIKREEVISTIEEIDITRTKIKTKVINKTNELFNKYATTRDEVLENKEIFVKIVKDITKSELGGHIINYIKFPDTLDYSIRQMSVKNFLKYFNEEN